MKHERSLVCLVASIVAATFTPPAGAQCVSIHFRGYGWETGRVPPGDHGDVLSLTAAADVIDPIFGVDLGFEEVTLYVDGLTSTGEIDLGDGNVLVEYAGGQIEVYRDAARDHDWDVFPPNSQLSTFTNGTLMAAGDFVSFAVLWTSPGVGPYQGRVQVVEGEIGIAHDGLNFLFEGTFAPDEVTPIPEGYDLEATGVFELDPAIPFATDATGWGRLKSLFAD